MSIKEQLKQDPPADKVKKLSGSDAQHLPPDVVQDMLDEVFDKWSVTYFKCDIMQNGKRNSVIAVVTLEVSGLDYNCSRKGTVTKHISPDDLSDYSGTLLPYCVADAARSLGRYFGRHLNSSPILGIEKLPPPSELIVRQYRTALATNDIDKCYSLMRQYDFSEVKF